MKKGEKYKCIKTVLMEDNDEIAYLEGKTYPCEQDDCITDEQGDKEHDWLVDYWQEYFILENSPMLYPDIQQLLELIDSRVRKVTSMGIHLQYEPCGAGGVYSNTTDQPLFLFSDKAEFITEANNWLR